MHTEKKCEAFEEFTKSGGEYLKFEIINELRSKFIISPEQPKNLFKLNVDEFRTVKGEQNKKLPIKQMVTIHSIAHLNDLITAMRNKTVLSASKKSLRYLVDRNSHIWFGYEGAPGQKIPAHFQMTGDIYQSSAALCAGNIVFKEVNGVLTIDYINHKSGNFCNNFNAMQHVLAILGLNDEFNKLIDGETVIIKPLSAAGGDITKDGQPLVYAINMDEMRQWVKENFDEKTIKAMSNQPQEKRTYGYESGNRVLVTDDKEPVKKATKRKFSFSELGYPLDLRDNKENSQNSSTSSPLTLFGTSDSRNNSILPEPRNVRTKLNL